MNNQIDLNGNVLHEWRHYYTEDEINQLKDQSINVRNEIDRLEDDRKATSASFLAALKERRAKEKTLRININVGFEDRRETCKVQMNYLTGMVEFWNQDGEKVDERKMTRKELQDGHYVSN